MRLIRFSWQLSANFAASMQTFFVRPPPDHIARLIERLAGEREERKGRPFQGVSL